MLLWQLAALAAIATIVTLLCSATLLGRNGWIKSERYSIVEGEAPGQLSLSSYMSAASSNIAPVAAASDASSTVSVRAGTPPSSAAATSSE